MRPRFRPGWPCVPVERFYHNALSGSCIDLAVSFGGRNTCELLAYNLIGVRLMRAVVRGAQRTEFSSYSSHISLLTTIMLLFCAVSLLFST